MFKKVKYAAVAALAIAAIGIGIGAYVGSAGDAEAAGDPVNTSNVYKFEDGSMVDGASATLVRTENGITASLNTDGLDTNHAYTLWWVVFNNPENCDFPVAGLTTCGEGDVFTDPFGATDVLVSVQFAAGNVVGRTGMINLGSHLNEGELPSGHG